MNISRIDLNLYIVLDAVFNEGSITGAAKVLNLTQPAVSHALNRLRDRLGDPLFSRQGRQMVPSPFTRRIMPDVRNALRILESTTEKDSCFDPGRAEKTFNIAIRDMSEPWLLGELVPFLRSNAPGIRLNSVHVNRRAMAQDLASGAIDLAIDILLPVGEKLRHAPASTDPVVVVVNPDHPRVRSASDLDIEAYLGEEHIQVSSRRKGPGFEDYELARLGYRRTIAMRCQSHYGACQVVRSSDLLLTLQQNHALEVSQVIDVRILPMPVSLPRLNSYVYWFESMDNDPAHTWLRSLILEKVQSSMIQSPAIQ